MMRLTRLLRPAKPIFLSTRSGPPGWQRPDPPVNEQNFPQGRIMPIHIGLFWFDGSSPIYFLHLPEIYEGDLLEALPKTLFFYGYFLCFVVVIGLSGALMNPKRKIDPLGEVLTAEEDIKESYYYTDQKFKLKYMLANPWKLNVWPEVYPHENYGKIQYSDKMTQLKKMITIIRTVNNDALKYWDNLYQQSANEIKHGLPNLSHGSSH